MPKTFILPDDYQQLLKDSEIYDGYYIYKSGMMSRGRSIKLLKNVAELYGETNAVVQHYMTNSLLVNGYKFDMRIYVLITNVNPLIAYIYPEGIGRFATEKF